MKLKKVEIHKYKSFSSKQEFDLENDITVLVGMNESGKTSVLEAIAKTNYFQDDKSFKFNASHDYPRVEKKAMDKSGVNPEAVTCTYEIDDSILEKIAEKLGEDIFKEKEFSITTNYSNGGTIANFNADKVKFISHATKRLDISSDILNKKLGQVQNLEDLEKLKNEYSDEKYINALSSLKKYFENKDEWPNPIEEYIYRKFIDPQVPKFLYYDEYFALPARISIEKLQNKGSEESENKTAKALFELADIDIDELTQENNFEDSIAELEATEATISDELFKYWKTNKNLNITFKIDKRADAYNTSIIEHILDIRVKHKSVSLSLKNRSKGFNWFFSFLVWFKKIQEDAESNYILLLDEPGLNLHASAQADLLRFLEDLAKDYQIIYTTHSPFMIAPDKLNRVRTVFEKEEYSVISNSIQEKDPNTLFPLQAALGYDIAQNLFVSQKNLLVEGVADLVILTAMSGILEEKNRTFLNKDITIVPVGGLEKVATFVSLLRGSKLGIACLLDSYTDPRGKAKMDMLIKSKIIGESKIRFFDKYVDGYDKADLEDLFAKPDYLKIFNLAFRDKYAEVKGIDLEASNKRIILQINQKIEEDRFNHYMPATQLAQLGASSDCCNEITLANFEKVFKDINAIFTN